MPGQEKPKALPFGTNGEVVPKDPIKVKPNKNTLNNPAVDQTLPKIKKKDNLMKRELNDQQIKTEVRSTTRSEQRTKTWNTN